MASTKALSPMHLVQILLPLYAQGGERLQQELFDAVREELVGRFGGLTAYSRAPATGLWRDPRQGGNRVDCDELVVYEVMVDRLDRAWWAAYRDQLTGRFQQKDLVLRALPVELL
jgi:hypothetical protein